MIIGGGRRRAGSQLRSATELFLAHSRVRRHSVLLACARRATALSFRSNSRVKGPSFCCRVLFLGVRLLNVEEGKKKKKVPAHSRVGGGSPVRKTAAPCVRRGIRRDLWVKRGKIQETNMTVQEGMRRTRKKIACTPITEHCRRGRRWNSPGESQTSAQVSVQSCMCAFGPLRPQ